MNKHAQWPVIFSSWYFSLHFYARFEPKSAFFCYCCWRWMKKRRIFLNSSPCVHSDSWIYSSSCNRCWWVWFLRRTFPAWLSISSIWLGFFIVVFAKMKSVARKKQVTARRLLCGCLGTRGSWIGTIWTYDSLVRTLSWNNKPRDKRVYFRTMKNEWGDTLHSSYTLRWSWLSPRPLSAP